MTSLLSSPQGPLPLGLLWPQRLVFTNYNQKYFMKERSTMNKIAIVFWSGTGLTVNEAPDPEGEEACRELGRKLAAW